MTSINTIPIFVYGSLKKDHYAEHYLKDATYCGQATTEQANWDMYAILAEDDGDKHYPGVQTGGEYRIEGELYMVDEDTLKKLDVFEEVGLAYTRKSIALDHPETKKAWMYIHICNNAKPDPSATKSRVACNAITKSLNWLLPENA